MAEQTNVDIPLVELVLIESDWQFQYPEPVQAVLESRFYHWWSQFRTCAAFARDKFATTATLGLVQFPVNAAIARDNSNLTEIKW